MNRNDALGRVEIYNAMAHGLDGSFSVTTALKSKVSAATHIASYDPAADRLVHSGVPDLWLPDILSLTFRKITSIPYVQ